MFTSISIPSQTKLFLICKQLLWRDSHTIQILNRNLVICCLYGIYLGELCLFLCSIFHPLAEKHLLFSYNEEVHMKKIYSANLFSEAKRDIISF